MQISAGRLNIFIGGEGTLVGFYNRLKGQPRLINDNGFRKQRDCLSFLFEEGRLQARGYKEKFILDFIFNATRNVRRGRVLLSSGGR